jgi:hypothetical protein
LVVVGNTRSAGREEGDTIDLLAVVDVAAAVDGCADEDEGDCDDTDDVVVVVERRGADVCGGADGGKDDDGMEVVCDEEDMRLERRGCRWGREEEEEEREGW